MYVCVRVYICVTEEAGERREAAVLVVFVLSYLNKSSIMVKVTFNSALAQKEVKKDSETLIPDNKVTICDHNRPFLFLSAAAD